MKRTNLEKKYYLGWIIILMGLFFNPFVVEWLFSPDGKLDFLWQFIVIIIFDIILVVVGFLVKNNSLRKRTHKNIKKTLDFINTHSSWDYSFKILDYKIFLIILVLALISIFYHLGFESLTYDEAWVTSCVMEPTMKEMIFCDNHYALLRPPVFLIATKVMTNLFGKNEFSLRLIPALFGFFSIVLIFLLSKKVTKNYAIALLSTVIFAFNPVVLKYSRLFKPYMGDVFFALLLFYLFEIFISEKFNKKIFLLLLIISIIATWTSYSSIFVIVTIILVLIWKLLKNANSISKKEVISIMVYIGVTIVSFLIHYFWIIRSQTKVERLLNYWQDGFIQSYNPIEMFIFVIGKTYMLFDFSSTTEAHNFFYLGSIGLLLLFVIGLTVVISRKQYRIIVYCLGPMTLVLLASFVKKYPYGGIRPDLFLIPIILIFSAIGLYFLISILRKHKHIVVVLVIIIIVLFILASVKHFTHVEPEEETRLVMNFYNENKLSNDYTYIYYSSKYTFYYYSDLINKSHVIEGKNYHKAPKKFLYELNYTIESKAKHNRLWIIYSHHFDFDREISFIKSMVNFTKSKCELITEIEENKASAYLFSC